MAMIIILAAFIVGVVIGLVLHYFGGRKQLATIKAERELEQTKNEFQQYQLQVGSHIAKTADLLDKIQDDFQQMQSHVFQSSQYLNLDSDKQSVLQPSSHFITSPGRSLSSQQPKPVIPNDIQDDKTAEPTKPNQPKDYA